MQARWREEKLKLNEMEQTLAVMSRPEKLVLGTSHVSLSGTIMTSCVHACVYLHVCVLACMCVCVELRGMGRQRNICL